MAFELPSAVRLHILFFDIFWDIPLLVDQLIPDKEKETLLLDQDIFEELVDIPSPDLEKTAREVVEQYFDDPDLILTEVTATTSPSRVCDESFLPQFLDALEELEIRPFLFRVKWVSQDDNVIQFGAHFQEFYTIEDLEEAFSKIPDIFELFIGG